MTRCRGGPGEPEDFSFRNQEMALTMVRNVGQNAAANVIR
jgi:hypothetical protein